MPEKNKVLILDQVAARLTAIKTGKDWQGNTNPDGYITTTKTVVYNDTQTLNKLYSLHRDNGNIFPRHEIIPIEEITEARSNDEILVTASYEILSYLTRTDMVDDSLITRKALMNFGNDIRQAMKDIEAADAAGAFSITDFEIVDTIKQTEFCRPDIPINGCFTEITFKYSQKSEV